MLGIVAVMPVALFRGDTLYLVLCAALCFAAAGIKLIAWQVYNRIM